MTPNAWTNRRTAGRIGLYGLGALILVYSVFPFYWAVVTSLKGGSELFEAAFWPRDPADGPSVRPHHWTCLRPVVT